MAHRTKKFVVRVGRYGPFVEHGDRKASLPDQMAPDEVTLEKALELLEGAAKGEERWAMIPRWQADLRQKRSLWSLYSAGRQRRQG